jgi:hypothetical protein
MARPRKYVDINEVIALRSAGQSYRSIARQTGHGVGTIFRCHQETIASLAAFQNPKAAKLRAVTTDESQTRHDLLETGRVSPEMPK